MKHFRYIVLAILSSISCVMGAKTVVGTMIHNEPKYWFDFVLYSDNTCAVTHLGSSIEHLDVVTIPTTIYNSKTGETYNVTKIDPCAFARLYEGNYDNFLMEIDTLKIPASINCLANCALSNANAKNIIFDEDCDFEFEDDGFCMFAFSQNLEYVKFPKKYSCGFIGNNFFANCSRLKRIEIPETYTSIRAGAFYGCESLEYFKIRKDVKFEAYWTTKIRGIYKYKRTDSETGYIYEVYGDYGHTATFDNCDNLTLEIEKRNVTCTQEGYVKELVFSEGTESIKFIAWGSRDVPPFLCQTLTLPKSVRLISGKLEGVVETINFPDECDYLELSPKFFADVYNLKKVNLPKGLAYIPDSLFYNCTNLTEVRIPEDVSSIGAGAFMNCKSLTSVDLPNGVNSLGDNLFSGCGALESIKLSNTISSIGNYAFKGCLSLKNLYLPATLSSIGTGAFSGCAGLTTITLGDGITSIGDNWFNGCMSLETIKFSNTLNSIGNNAFKGCSKLKSLDLPATLTSIGRDAFSGCASLTTITLGDGITSIGDNWFNGCSTLETIKFSNTLNSIGNSAFKGCSKLKSLDLPATLSSIGTDAFSGCASLTSITLGDGITSIGNNWFNGCSALETIKFSAALKSIGNGAFKGCGSLKSIDLPATLTSIGADAFSGCASITTVMLGDGITSIGDNTFNGCSALEIVKTPDALKSIGNGAFKDCYSLTKIQLPSTLTSIGTSAFNNCNIKEVILQNVEIISDSAFYSNPKLNRVTVGTQKADVGKSAFAECRNLSELRVPKNTVFREESLLNCGNLQVSDFSDYNRFDRYAFGKQWFNEQPAREPIYKEHIFLGYNDLPPVLSDVTIKDGTKIIADNAFYLMSSLFRLKDVRLPDGIVTIGDNAFKNISCASLNLPKSVENFVWSGLPQVKVLNLGDVNTWLKIGAYYDEKLSYSMSKVLGSDYKMYENNNLLTVLNISDANTIIPDYAFSGNNYLKTVNVQSKSIGNSAFRESAITSVTTSEHLELVEDYAFANCANLSHFEFGRSERITLGGYVFDSSNKLTSMVALCPPPAFLDSRKYVVFYNFNCGACTLLVPGEYIELYRNHAQWSKFNIGYSGINDIVTDGDAIEVARYDINGILLTEPQPGINIVRYSDGTTKKELVK